MSNIIVISAEVDGPVSQLAVQNNQPVGVGELLLEIEHPPCAEGAQWRGGAGTGAG